MRRCALLANNRRFEAPAGMSRFVSGIGQSGVGQGKQASMEIANACVTAIATFAYKRPLNAHIIAVAFDRRGYYAPTNPRRPAGADGRGQAGY